MRKIDLLIIYVTRANANVHVRAKWDGLIEINVKSNHIFGT